MRKETSLSLEYDIFIATLEKIINATQRCHSMEDVTFSKQLEQETKVKVHELAQTVVGSRRTLWESLLEGNFGENQRMILEYAKRYLGDTRDKTIRQLVEYELTFLGINYSDDFTFCPWFLGELRKSRTRSELFAEYSPIMVANEKERRIYSIQPENLDKNWSLEPNQLKLAEGTIKEFLAGKEKVLEVGFWNRTLYDALLKINPDLVYYGVDSSVPSVQFARDSHMPRIYPANAIWAIPLLDRSVDAIILCNFFTECSMPSLEMQRVVKKGGSILNFYMPGPQKVEIYKVE